METRGGTAGLKLIACTLILATLCSAYAASEEEKKVIDCDSFCMKEGGPEYHNIDGAASAEDCYGKNNPNSKLFQATAALMEECYTLCGRGLFVKDGEKTCCCVRTNKVRCLNCPCSPEPCSQGCDEAAVQCQLQVESAANATTTTSSTTTTTVRRGGGGGGGSGRQAVRTPTCTDGIKNQDEEGADCGGPCRPCGAAKVVFEADDVKHVQEGERFVIRALVGGGGGAGGLTPIVTTPRFFTVENYSGGADLGGEDSREVEWELRAEDGVSAGLYYVNITLVDSQGRIYAAEQVEVVVHDPISLLGTEIRIQHPKVIQDRVFSFMRKAFSTAWGSGNLYIAIGLILLAVAYKYYALRGRRHAKPEGAT